MKKKHILFLSLILISHIGFSQDFEVSPVKIFFTAEPGESQTKTLVIKNHSSKLETFILNLQDISINSKGESSFEEAGSLRNSIADWLSIAPSFFELEANAEKEISITLQQPANEYGSKWGVIFVRTAKEQTNFSVDKGISAGMFISGRVAVNIYQSPGSNRNYKAEIKNLAEKSNQSDSIRIFSAIVNNLAEIITDCKVFLIATDITSGVETYFEPNNFTMYPKSSRTIEIPLSLELQKGTYSLAAILDYGSKENLEGSQLIIQVE